MLKNKYFDKVKELYDKKLKSTVDEWMSKTAVLRTGKRKITYNPVKVALVLLCVILVLMIICSAIGSVLRPKSVEVTLESGSTYKTRKISDDILIYNNRGVKAVNSGGKTVWQIDEAMSDPIAECDGKYLLLADLGGNHYAASYKNGKIVNEYKFDKDIISAKITEKGYVAIATDTDGYKGKVSLFNKRGSEIYAWNSGSGYISDIDISDNGRYLAVAQLVTDENAANTRIQIIDTNRGEVISTVERKNEVTAEVKFVSANKLLVVTDNHILAYTRGGKEKFSISLEGKEASLYNIDSDSLIAVGVMDNRGNSVLELYSSYGKYRGSYVAVGDIRAVDVSSSTVVVAEQRGIVRVNSRGKAKKTVSVEHDIKDVGLYSDTKRVMAVGYSEAEIVTVK